MLLSLFFHTMSSLWGPREWGGDLSSVIIRNSCLLWSSWFAFISSWSFHLSQLSQFIILKNFYIFVIALFYVSLYYSWFFKIQLYWGIYLTNKMITYLKCTSLWPNTHMSFSWILKTETISAVTPKKLLLFPFFSILGHGREESCPFFSHCESFDKGNSLREKK